MPRSLALRGRRCGRLPAPFRNRRRPQGPMLIEAFTYRMGAHTTTDDPTRYRLSSELEAWRLRDPIERVRVLPGPHRRGRQRLLRGGQRGRRRGSGAVAGLLPGAARSAAAGAVRRRLRRAGPDPGRRARPVRGLPRRIRRRGRSGGREHGGKSMSTITLSRALNEGLRRSLRVRPQGDDHGGGHRQARWRVPGDRGTPGGLRRSSRGRHAARRVGGRRHRRRPGHAGVPAGVRDPVRRLRLPRVRPDRLPGGQDAYRSGAGSPCRS